MVLHASQPAVSGSPSSLLGFLRTLHQRGRSGTLEVLQGDQLRRFYFVRGELYLVQGHPLAQRMASFLEVPEESSPKMAALLRRPPQAGATDPASKAAQELRWLLRRIAKFLHQLEGERFQFEEGEEELPAELVGPLPTGFLIMEAAVMDRSEESLIEKLGGDEARWVAESGDRPASDLLWMETDEAFLLSRCERPISIGELRRQAPGGASVITRLARLRAIGLIRQAGDEAEPIARDPAERRRVQPEVVERFAERVRRDLERRPLGLEPDEHRERLGELLASLGEKNLYQLLGVRPDAAIEKVLDGFNRLARLVHPDHAARLELAGGEAALDLLFERATEAYLTLSDPDRRGRYNSEAGILFATEEEDEEAIRERERETAREYFVRARQHIGAQQLHAAHELLREATRLDPRADYFALLAQVQSKNPNWVRQAVDNYRRAVELDPRALEHRLALALTCEEAGYLTEAKVQFEKVLEQMPGHPIAGAGLKRIDHQRSGPDAPASGSWLTRLKRRLGSIFGRAR